MNETSGVYAITHEAGKVYIGHTTDFKRRWRGHRSELRRGVHSNPLLQRAWNAQGESCFEFGILEYLDDLEQLHLAEQWWMDIYREEGKELYNRGPAARRHPWRARKRDEEAGSMFEGYVRFSFFIEPALKAAAKAKAAKNDESLARAIRRLLRQWIRGSTKQAKGGK